MYRNLTLSLLSLLVLNSSSLLAQCVDDLLINIEKTSHTIFFEAVFESVSPETELTYFWDLGDGTTSAIPQPVHTYDNAGSYEVCLSVTTIVNGENCMVESCETVVINFALPCSVTAAFEWIDAGDGEVVVQELCETNSFTSVTNIEWETSEGVQANGLQASMSFEDLTSPEVCLTVQAISQGNECTSVLCKTVELEIPELNLTPEFVVKENDGCEFRLINITDENGFEEIAFEWIVEEQDVDYETQPLVQFAENGAHEVCLEASVPWYGEVRTVVSCLELTSNCSEENDVMVANTFQEATQLVKEKQVSIHISNGNLVLKSFINEVETEAIQYRIYDLRGSLLKEGNVSQGDQIPLNGIDAQLILVEIVGSSFRQVEKIQLLN